MTWDIMTTYVKKIDSLIKDENGSMIGLVIEGGVYDGDGNPQDLNGTKMEIVFDSEKEFLQFVNSIQCILDMPSVKNKNEKKV